MSEAPENVLKAYSTLPPSWRLEKLKFFAGVRNSNVDKTIQEGEIPVKLCNYVDVYYHDRITRDIAFMWGSATEAEIEKFQLKKSQVILTKDSESWEDIGIPALVTEDMPDVVCGYHLSILEGGHELDGAYLAWLCRSDPLNDQFKTGANGVTRYGLGQYSMKNAFIPLPPLATQRRIAAFLDEKTARIDGLIAKKRELLERLAEKRQALITRAVTKGLSAVASAKEGLDPDLSAEASAKADAPMKPSGIDWLGVPAHWEVVPIKRLKHFVTSGSRGWASLYADQGDLFLRMTNVTKGGIEIDTTDVKFVDIRDTNEGTRTAVRNGDILITITAELGSVAIVRPPLVGSYINQHLALLRVNRQLVDPEFLVNFLSTDAARAQFALNGQGGTKQGLGFAEVDAVDVSLPPLKEQKEIVHFANSTWASETNLERNISESIDLLAEYRSALITAAVTGQIPDLQ